MKTFTLKDALRELGVNAQQAALSTGIKANTIYRHIGGSRKVSALHAIQYERGLGIPKEKLRPDIFGIPHTQEPA